MKEINEEDYAAYFPTVFTWFRKNVHGEDYPFDILDLRSTSRKLIELKHSVTGNVLFRVIIKMTTDPINKVWKPTREFTDLDYLFNTKTNNNVSRITSPQICYIQVDSMGNPKDAIIYTYSPDDEKYHAFPIS